MISLISKRNKINLLGLITLLFTLLIILLRSTVITAEPDCDNPGFGDLDYCIQKIQNEVEALKPAHEYNKKELSDLKNQITSLNAKINGVLKQLDVNEEDIKKREEDLAYANEIFNQKTLHYYKFIRFYDPLIPFLASDNATGAFREIAFRKRATSQDIKTMEGYVSDLVGLKNDRENLEKNKTNLSSLKTQIDQRAGFLEGEVLKTEKYLSELSSRQEELAALKAGGFQTSIGDTPPTQDPCSGPPGSNYFCDPSFRPAYAVFSFGAPHRTGMSQYGAYGRAKTGQSAETILSSYYQGTQLQKGYPVPATIGVDGYGRIAFEDNYLLGIYEIPESWGDNGGYEALKAQAVAARSYALAVTSNGAGSICPTESCQVYKPQLKSGKWAQAVRDTRGWVMTRGGGPATTYYASTSGGYTISQWGWTGIKDAKDGDWPGQAYEKIAGSPWFYKGWFKTRSGTSCGRTHPWLTSSEMADIINAWTVLYKGGGDVSRISPIDTSCWGGNPYSISELSSIGGYISVSGVSVVYSNSGSTLNVTFQTNKGNISISGEEFKKAFNLRAPGYIGVKSSLFNIEKL